MQQFDLDLASPVAKPTYRAFKLLHPLGVVGFATGRA